MTEFSSPENRIAGLRHPAVIPLGEFEAAYGAGHETYAQTKIERLQKSETERDQPGGFRDLVAAQDLDSISTTAHIMERATHIVDELQPMTPEERFDTLLTWRSMAKTGSKLSEVAEKSIRLAIAKQELGLQNKTISEFSDEEFRAVHARVYPHDVPHDHFPSRLNSDNLAWQAIQAGRDVPLPLLPPTQQDAPDYIRHGEDFAQYNDGLKAYLLFMTTAEMSADQVGRDLLSGRPVVKDYNVDIFERAQAYTRQLPQRLSGWHERGLVGADDVPEHFAGGYGRNYDIVRRVATIVAGASGEEIANLYIEPYKEYYDFLDGRPAHQYPEENPLEEQKKARLKHRDLADNRLPEALRIFQSRILEELVPAFAEATASVHPTIENRARRLAAYILSNGHGWARFNWRLQEARSEPLAASVSILQSIVEEIGFGGNKKNE